MTYEPNKNSVRIEKNLVQQNLDLAKEKTRFFTVNLESSTLILSKSKTSEFSEEQQQIIEELGQLEQQKKLYNQLMTENPSGDSKSGISDDPVNQTSTSTYRHMQNLSDMSQAEYNSLTKEQRRNLPDPRYGFSLLGKKVVRHLLQNMVQWNSKHPTMVK